MRVEDEVFINPETTNGQITTKAEPAGETYTAAPADGGGGTMQPQPLTYGSGDAPADGGGGSPPEDKPPTGFFPGVTRAQIQPLFIFILIGIAILMFNSE